MSLDLEAIKVRLAVADCCKDDDDQELHMLNEAAEELVAHDVPALIAEVERLRNEPSHLNAIWMFENARLTAWLRYLRSLKYPADSFSNKCIDRALAGEPAPEAVA